MNLKERVTRLEEKVRSASNALKLARDSVSKNNLAVIATFILSVLAVALQWIKK